MIKDIYAQFYDYWHTNQDPQEYAFYKKQAQKAAGAILEIGCGTGRLLLPLLKDGYVVEGLDSSRDMLTICNNKARVHNLKPITYHQTIEALDLPKKYSLIFSALETFQHIANRKDALKALRALYSHLEIGGSFAIYLSLPWLYAPDNAREWRQIAKTQKNNATYSLHEKSIHDPIEQLYYHSYVIKKNNITLHTYESTIRWYSVHEFKSMLACVGFKSIQLQSGYSSDGPYDVILFTAQK